ncbi:hypothetical protein IF1G_00139 [Cordyceps javanica]|uniref:Uncharacterized protein n=1 Tax=Cordyceps javanica TaxID=43265 RepID=A0A545VEP9_9HYPO|nr:hypothetical protein IF1G_00139 [Cordyceps javanica]
MNFFILGNLARGRGHPKPPWATSSGLVSDCSRNSIVPQSTTSIMLGESPGACARSECL